MMFTRTILLTAATVMLSGCGASGADQGPVHFTGDSPAVETVNGVVISQALLDAYARARRVNVGDPDARDKALRELSDYVILGAEAKRAQYDSGSQFQADVEIARLQAVANATAAQIEKETPLSDEILKAEYDQQVARAGKYIYAFTQLLFTDEKEALAACGDVASGKPFSAVYETYRKTARQAKGFTQVRLSQLPEALGEALKTMQPGDTTLVPVKTEFGYHVVNLTSTTPFVPTSFETVKEAVRKTILEQSLAQRLKTLRDQSQVVVVGGSGALKPAATPGPRSVIAPRLGEARNTEAAPAQADPKPTDPRSKDAPASAPKAPVTPKAPDAPPAHKS